MRPLLALLPFLLAAAPANSPRYATYRIFADGTYAGTATAVTDPYGRTGLVAATGTLRGCNERSCKITAVSGFGTAVLDARVAATDKDAGITLLHTAAVPPNAVALAEYPAQVGTPASTCVMRANGNAVCRASNEVSGQQGISACAVFIVTELELRTPLPSADVGAGVFHDKSGELLGVATAAGVVPSSIIQGLFASAK